MTNMAENFILAAKTAYLLPFLTQLNRVHLCNLHD